MPDNEVYVTVRVIHFLKLRGKALLWAQGVGWNPKHWAVYLYLPHRGYAISLHGISRV